MVVDLVDIPYYTILYYIILLYHTIWYFIIKIVNQIDDLPISTFFQIAGHVHATRSIMTIEPSVEGREPQHLDNRNFVKQKSKLDIRKNSFSHRVVDHWNNLPNSVKNAADVNNFKNLYDAFKNEKH